MTLTTLFEDLWQEPDEGIVTILALLDLSAAFNIIDHGILLDRICELDGAVLC